LLNYTDPARVLADLGFFEMEIDNWSEDYPECISVPADEDTHPLILLFADTIQQEAVS
jgi:hypothetical protein